MRLVFGDREYDQVRRRLSGPGGLIEMEPQVLRLLEYFLDQGERLVSRDQILEAVWGGRFVSDAALTSRIRSVREAVGDNGRDQAVIQTVRGVGYRFVAEVARPDALDRRLTHNLPGERTPLVGREEETTEILGLVEAHRLVALLGFGGIGKTRLALNAARSAREVFGEGVWFVDLVSLGSQLDVTRAIASALRLNLSDSEPVQSLAELLRHRETLLVLDNCEDLIDEVADLVDRLLDGTEDVRILLTSREPTELPDETRYYVPPLETGGEGSAAVQLFIASANRAGVQLETDELHDVVQVCQRLDGLPLAIELAGAQAIQLRPEQLAEQLDHRVLASPRRRGKQSMRQSSLSAVLESSWERLTQDARGLLRQTAVLPSTFAAVDAVELSDAAEPDTALTDLINRGLLVAEGASRLRQLETIRRFARSRSSASQMNEYVDRLVDWVLALVSEYSVEDRYTSSELATWMAAHYPQVQLAERRLSETERLGELATLVQAQNVVAGFSGGLIAGALITRADHYLSAHDFTRHDRGVVTLAAAMAGLPARRPDWLIGGARRAAKDLAPLQAPEAQAWAGIIESFAFLPHQPDLATAKLHGARSIAARSGLNTLVDVAMGYLASCHALNGNTETAMETLGELRHRLGDRPFDRGWVEYHLMVASLKAITNPEEASHSAQTLLTAFRRVNGSLAVPWPFHLLLASTLAAHGQFGATRQALDQLHQAIENDGTDNGFPDLLVPFAMLAWRLGDHALAQRWLTAVHAYPNPTHNLMTTLVYRSLRDHVTLDDTNPLEHRTFDEVAREARAWLRHRHS